MFWCGTRHNWIQNAGKWVMSLTWYVYRRYGYIINTVHRTSFHIYSNTSNTIPDHELQPDMHDFCNTIPQYNHATSSNGIVWLWQLLLTMPWIRQGTIIRSLWTVLCQLWGGDATSGKAKLAAMLCFTRDQSHWIYGSIGIIYLFRTLISIPPY